MMTADRRRCREIYRDGRIAAFSWLDPQGFRLDDFDEDCWGEESWVAVDAKERPLGFVSLESVGAFIHLLFVDPLLRGQGLGGDLFHVAVAHASRPVTLFCVERNRPARQFYERLGCVAEGRGAGGVHGPYIIYRYSPS